ncbi:amylo-alpha-1,6-glucosidase [Flammeovirga sp. OC4]|uniref:amylo-alpha-1,6-glucosidase n=1 Tax=Flammeovirga sp. OC4 TaxID=1382345 RepID=UPI000693DACC|nr:amylo-alpha-1,6-glucosidase [Flammeovirga sp. OC4]
MRILKSTFILLALTLFYGCAKENNEHKFTAKEAVKDEVLQELKVDVAAAENRVVTYTNKRSAYFQTQTHVLNSELYSWFNGWNIGQKRILTDYDLTIDGQPFDRANAKVEVFPHYLQRATAQGTERVILFDDQDVIYVDFHGVKGSETNLTVTGDQIKLDSRDQYASYFVPSESKDHFVVVAPSHNEQIDKEGNAKVTASGKGGFYISYAKTKEEGLALIQQARTQHGEWLQERTDRMTQLITENTAIKTEDPHFDKALMWLTLTMDEMVTHQRGYGIYAGIPWFNEYWGRDTFISLPGGTLVLGETEVAKKILLSFADVQDKKSTSKYYGRIPNIVKMESLNYHTTDGTPRFIFELLDYIQYSGDNSLIKEMYPTVKRSVDGALKNWVNKKGYLTHEDADTWMDARREPDHVPYSPRGSYANDIQALWFKQLNAAIYCAKETNHISDMKRWQKIADKVQANFNKDFFDDSHAYMADRIDHDDQPDFQFRPNQLFAMDFMTDDVKKMELTREIWEHLVYPWGVASLSQEDPNFHPYHLAWEHYHKDAAYHNGTIWQWNNGYAMQRMIESGQPDIAFQLFENMNEQSLDMGAVGSMNENADAFPHPGESYPKLTGTYMQAWSNGEQLRVWYQYFLGLRPNAIENTIVLAPRMPSKLNNVSYKEKLMGGTLVGQFERQKEVEIYTYTMEGKDVTLSFEHSLFQPIAIDVKAGEKVLVTRDQKELTLTVFGVDGKQRELKKEHLDEQLQKRQENSDKIFEGTQFCKPSMDKEYEAMKQTFQKK